MTSKAEISDHESSNLDNETAEDSIEKKHRREKRELINKFTGLKHSLNKNDKKGKKDLIIKQQAEEAELEARHKNELLRVQSSSVGNSSSVAKEEAANEAPSLKENQALPDLNQEKRPSKAKKRREMREDQNRKLDQILQDSETLSKSTQRQMERESMERFLASSSLSMVEIPADGDCLFSAVAHQTSLLDHNLIVTVGEIRHFAAEVMRQKKQEFLPFYDGQKDHRSFDEYCDKIENTKMWGGNLELKALSIHFQRPINVLQSDGSVISIEEANFACKEPATVVYLKSDSSAGGHYNSTKPCTLDTTTPDSDSKEN